MTTEEVQRLEGFQRELRERLHDLDEPKIALNGDDECCEIIGNEAAFIRLAIDSLDVARRRDQAFVPPLSGNHIPLQIAALRFDPNPEPAIQREQPWWGRFIAFLILGLIALVFFAGLLTVLAWIQHLVAGWFHR